MQIAAQQFTDTGIILVIISVPITITILIFIIILIRFSVIRCVTGYMRKHFNCDPLQRTEFRLPTDYLGHLPGVSARSSTKELTLITL